MGPSFDDDLDYWVDNPDERCECELDWNCGCGRYGGAPPIDALNTWWSKDHP